MLEAAKLETKDECLESADRVAKPEDKNWSSLFGSADKASQRAILLQELQELDVSTASSSTALGVGLAVPVDLVKPCLDVDSSDADSFKPSSQRHLTYQAQSQEFASQSHSAEDNKNIFLAFLVTPVAVVAAPAAASPAAPLPPASAAARQDALEAEKILGSAPGRAASAAALGRGTRGGGAGGEDLGALGSGGAESSLRPPENNSAFIKHEQKLSLSDEHKLSFSVKAGSSDHGSPSTGRQIGLVRVASAALYGPQGTSADATMFDVAQSSSQAPTAIGGADLSMGPGDGATPLQVGAAAREL